jgi:hypothetical protein
MALAREFDAAGNNIEDTSNKEKTQLKKWLATVSTQKWLGLLDKVEGEQDVGTTCLLDKVEGEQSKGG